MCINTSGCPHAFAHPLTCFPHAHCVFPTEVKLETHHILNRIQTLLRSLGLVCTGLKTADRFMVDFALSIVEHRFLVKVLGIDPLQWDPLGEVAGGVEVMAALDLELESIPHITSRVDQNADLRVSVRAHKVR